MDSPRFACLNPCLGPVAPQGCADSPGYVCSWGILLLVAVSLTACEPGRRETRGATADVTSADLRNEATPSVLLPLGNPAHRPGGMLLPPVSAGNQNASLPLAVPAPAANRETPDTDHDDVADSVDNCPDAWNPDQWDTDADGVGDRCETQTGTPEYPYLVPGRNPGLPAYRTAGNTCEAPSSFLGSYPPNLRNESGPEVYYALRTEVPVHLTAYIASPEPAGTDVDLHLLASLEPLVLVQRSDREVSVDVPPGQYLLVLDTFHDGVQPLCGPYILTVEMRAITQATSSDPLVPGGTAETPLPLPFVFEDAGTTKGAASDELEGYELAGIRNLNGPERVYSFTLDQSVRLSAVLRFPEPTGVDVDLVLLSQVAPLTPLVWGDRAVYAQLGPGTYYLVVDTVEGGSSVAGAYNLMLSIRPTFQLEQAYFNEFVMSAVDYLYAIHGLQGYASAVLTHDMTYGSYGSIAASDPPRTMCVAAVMEVILQAMSLYADDTGESAVWDFLPIDSWRTLKSSHIKAHIWVNSELQSSGTADALTHFGMGANVPFEELTPGSFLNLNRTTGTGHAVVFVAFIDEAGHEYGFHNYSTVGFKYFSAQGGAGVWQGGLDYRYAVFDAFGTPTMPYKRDIHVIYSANQDWLNTGVMFHPKLWKAPMPGTLWAPRQGVFNPQMFDGRTE